MQRQKVNGNGIRAAGNPDEEPNLSLFPACPPGTNVVKPVVPPTVQLLPPSVPQTTVQRQTRQSSSADTVTSQNTRDDAVLRASSGQQVSFPLKLQRILDKFEAMGEPQPISWQKHGRAFIVHDSTRFVEEVMPVYFNQSKFSSFQRQLHMYNFQRITSPGADKGYVRRRLRL